MKILTQSKWAYLIALGAGTIGGFAGSIFGIIPGRILWYSLLDVIFMDWVSFSCIAFSILFAVFTIAAITLFDLSLKRSRRFKLAFVAAIPWVLVWLIYAWTIDVHYFRLGSTITGAIVGSPAILIPCFIPYRSPSNKDV